MSTWEGLSPPYATIVADPPWRYSGATYAQTGTTAGWRKGILTAAKTPGTRPDARSRYSTMTSTDVAALAVGDLAARSAHLYLWVTNPILPEAFAVLPAWGFRYVTLLTWRKLGTLGMGYYFRGDTEHVLFGVRGKCPIPAAIRVRNWFEAAKTGHSRKPDSFFDIVQRVSPGPYVELFARAPRLGWDSWGHGYELSGAVS